MPYFDFREYLEALDESGELHRVTAEVDPYLEVGAVMQRIAERGGPAVHFQNVRGAQLGVSLLGGMMSRGNKGLWSKAAVALNLDPLASYRDVLEQVWRRTDSPIRPIQGGGGPCTDLILGADEVDLTALAAPQLHEGDGGRYLSSWGFTVAREPGTDYVASDLVPQMVLSKNKLTGCLQRSSELGRLYYERYEPAEKPMPFAIVLGAAPVVTMAAAFQRRRGGAGAAELAGGLQRAPIQLVECESSDLLVPASAEMILEGFVAPRERAQAGPFPGAFGYRLPELGAGPVFQVTTITHRENPILPFCTWGTPTAEIHITQGLDRDAQLSQHFEKNGAPVIDVFTPPWLAGSVVAISTRIPYTAYAQAVAGAVRITEGTKHVPYIVVCDNDIDITNPVALFHALVTKCHPERDTWIIKKCAASPDAPYLTAAERKRGEGARAIFDCTWPLDWDRSIAVPPKVSFDQCYPKTLQEKVLAEWTGPLGFPAEAERPA
jgi:4-hydroxy-3-polyprenylbenzoate decarboxylase